MEYAHDRNVVHRDIKPANIKVADDSSVKVLDFGLAKALADDPQPGSDPRNSPTLTLTMATTAGTILGTAAYMSPEQAKGKSVDRRADVWAFGVVLYEMLTARQLFTGEGAGEILASVIKETVSLDALPPTTPQAIRALIGRCIEKDPKRRLQAIGEASIAVEDAVASDPPITPGATAPDPDGAPSGPRSDRRWPWIAAASLLALATLAFVHFREPSSTPQSPIRFQLPPPGPSAAQHFKLSPNGRTLAFIAPDNGTDRVWLRSLDAIDAHAIPGTDGATYPFWSPDSANLGFFAQGKLKRMSVTSGTVASPAQSLCDALDNRGASWGSDGVIVFAPGVNSGLFRIPATGGVAQAMPQYTSPPRGASLRFPEFLPASNRFLYVISGDAENSGIYTGSLDGAAPVRLSKDVSQTAFIPSASGGDGTLLFRRESTLMAQPFDPRLMRTTGEPLPLAAQIGEAGNTGFAAFSAASSATGSSVLVYQSGSGSQARELVWRDRAGKSLGTAAALGKTAPTFGFALSPNGKRVAFELSASLDKTDLWLQELDRGTATRFTFGVGTGYRSYPVWSPDNTRVTYSVLADLNINVDLFTKPAGGASKEELLLHGRTNTSGSDWSNDGKFLVYSQTGDTTRDDLWLLPMEGEHKPALYLQTPANENQGQFSPDSKFMAYESDESGQYQVYVQPIPPNGAKWQISPAGGGQPRWRRDGRELFYVAADGKLMVVTIGAAGNFLAGTPQPLFERIDSNTADREFFYQPSADGQRFLVNSPAAGGTAQATPLTVVLNWNQPRP